AHGGVLPQGRLLAFRRWRPDRRDEAGRGCARPGTFEKRRMTVNRQVRTANLIFSTILTSVVSLIVGCEGSTEGDPQSGIPSGNSEQDVPGKVVVESGGVTEKATDYFDTGERFAASQNLYMCVLSRVGGD